MNELDLVIFEVAGVTYAADLGQVLRIDFDDPLETVGAPLGKPTHGRRALAFVSNTGLDCRLAVDVVRGVSRVPVEELRRLPAVASKVGPCVGAWIQGDRTILLVDLSSMSPQSNITQAA